MDFSGQFETHFTIAVDRSDVELGGLRAWASPRGLKCTHIVLARGCSASQPMLTRQGVGGLYDQLLAAREVADELGKAGFAVTRVKIEAAPGNQDIPQSDAEALNQPSAERYFEHHIKLELHANTDLNRLAAVVDPHCAHVSRNALRVREAGAQERFVTQRCHGVGQPAARQRLAALLAALAGAGYEILEHEEEFVVYDSNIGLDAGWIGAKE
jgi:hypothetical protein